ncbi:MAG: hypothetical protein ACRDJO_09200 [Actinomycetota bacterium]
MVFGTEHGDDAAAVGGPGEDGARVSNREDVAMDTAIAREKIERIRTEEFWMRGTRETRRQHGRDDPTTTRPKGPPTGTVWR